MNLIFLSQSDRFNGKVICYAEGVIGENSYGYSGGRKYNRIEKGEGKKTRTHADKAMPMSKGV